MLKKFVYTLLSFVISLALAVLVLFWLAEDTRQQKLQLATPELLQVERGNTPVALLGRLEQRGVISGSIWIRLLWRLQQSSPGVQIGEYSIDGQMTVADLLEKWRSGEVEQYRLTLVEGWNFTQLRAAMARTDELQHSIGELSDGEIMRLLGQEGVHPEGQFYPDTYYFTRGQKDLELLRQANQRLRQVLAEEWEQRAEGLPYSGPEQALIMASIIEKETGAAHERKQIAGVFVRRLQKRMLLQTDPTVIYGMGDSYQGRIRRSDLRTPTPYNTYVIRGLPPTPIAMVGREAIHAALHPADGDSLYFVAKGDGTHHFSSTLAEHNRAVRKYQLQRRPDYRSTVEPQEQQ